MRLLGDPTERATVEVYDGFNWGRVCGEFVWNIKEAEMVCRHFGYQTALGAIRVPIGEEIIRSKFLQSRFCGDYPHATSLLQCETRITAYCLCSKYDAGVVCSKGKRLEEGTSADSIGRGCQFHSKTSLRPRRLEMLSIL